MKYSEFVKANISKMPGPTQPDRMRQVAELYRRHQRGQATQSGAGTKKKTNLAGVPTPTEDDRIGVGAGTKLMHGGRATTTTKRTMKGRGIADIDPLGAGNSLPMIGMGCCASHGGDLEGGNIFDDVGSTFKSVGSWVGDNVLPIAQTAASVAPLAALIL